MDLSSLRGGGGAGAPIAPHLPTGLGSTYWITQEGTWIKSKDKVKLFLFHFIDKSCWGSFRINVNCNSREQVPVIQMGAAQKKIDEELVSFCICLPNMDMNFSWYQWLNPFRYILRASAWETGADLEMKVSRFCLKLVHKFVMWTYVICQSFRFNDLFLAEFWILAPHGSSEADVSAILATFQSLF